MGSSSASASARLQLALLALALLLAGCSSVAAASDEEAASCAQASETYRVAKITKIDNCPLGTGTGGETRSKCPNGMQTTITELYTACGGLVIEGGIDWDAEIGSSVKYTVERCGCAGAARSAPVLTLLVVLLMAKMGLDF